MGREEPAAGGGEGERGAAGCRTDEMKARAQLHAHARAHARGGAPTPRPLQGRRGHSAQPRLAAPRAGCPTCGIGPGLVPREDAVVVQEVLHVPRISV